MCKREFEFFRNNVELEVFRRTVGHPYLVQLVTFFQTKVCSSYLNISVFRQLLILKFSMPVIMQRCSCKYISVRSCIGHLLLLHYWSYTKNRGIYHQSQLYLYFYVINSTTVAFVSYIKLLSALSQDNCHSNFLRYRNILFCTMEKAFTKQKFYIFGSGIA